MGELVVLATDACLFALLAFGVAFWIVARRTEHLRAPWREVWRRPAAVGGATVLAAFMLVAVADSVRFRAQGNGAAPDGSVDAEVLSVLDLWLTPLRTRVETSYSAPLATHAYSRESVSDEAGGLRRVHPRLRHGGAHLVDPARDRAGDIARRALAGAAGGLLCGLLAGALVIAFEARRRRCALARAMRALVSGDTAGAWRALLVVFTALSIAAGVCAALGTHYHVLGTDKVGNDVLYQALKSIRTGILIGSLTTLISLPFALVLGIAAGYFRGVVDDVVQYLYTTLSSIPGVLLIAASALMLDVYMAKHAADFEALAVRADLRLLALCAILGITSWTSLCRLLRAEALKLREIEFVVAAQALGARHHRILRRHLLPNVMHIVTITTVLDFSGLVLAEAALTYIDIGVDPSMESWGNMINGARLELAREPPVWWSLAAAMGFMFVLVLAANLFADAVRDAFDPRLRTAGGALPGAALE
jgi:peptide/nickel transport system permease protein